VSACSIASSSSGKTATQPRLGITLGRCAAESPLWSCHKIVLGDNARSKPTRLPAYADVCID